MSSAQDTHAIDLVRWTFSVNPDHRAEIENHLTDLGLDVSVDDESKFVVTWDEPDRDVDEVIEEIWELNGTPFEVTHEEFHRLSLHTLNHADVEDAQAAA